MKVNEYALFASRLYQLRLVSVPLFLHFREKDEEEKEKNDEDENEDNSAEDEDEEGRRRKNRRNKKNAVSKKNIMKVVKKRFIHAGAFSPEYMTVIKANGYVLGDDEQETLQSVIASEVNPHHTAVFEERDEEPLLEQGIERLREHARSREERMVNEREKSHEMRIKKNNELKEEREKIQEQSEKRRLLKDKMYQVKSKREQDKEVVDGRLKVALENLGEVTLRLSKVTNHNFAHSLAKKNNTFPFLEDAIIQEKWEHERERIFGTQPVAKEARLLYLSALEFAPDNLASREQVSQRSPLSRPDAVVLLDYILKKPNTGMRVFAHFVQNYFDSGPLVLLVSAVHYKKLLSSATRSKNYFKRVAVDIWDRFVDMRSVVGMGNNDEENTEQRTDNKISPSRLKYTIKSSSKISSSKNRYRLFIPGTIRDKITNDVKTLMNDENSEAPPELFDAAVCVVFEALRCVVLPLFIQTPPYEKIQKMEIQKGDGKDKEEVGEVEELEEDLE